jgi:hypothetical protein
MKSTHWMRAVKPPSSLGHHRPRSLGLDPVHLGGKEMRKASRCFLLAMTVMVSAAGSAFAGEGDDEPTFEEKVIKKVLRGIGLDVGQERIEYRDRSPLVIPPNRDLPPPDSGAVVDNPNWPKDPDRQPKKKTGAKGNLSDSIVQSNRDRATLSRAEMEKGRVAGAGRVTEPGKDPIDNTSEYGGRPLSPDKLGTKKWFDWNPFGAKGEQAPFEREPERSSLTQPPPGYQTPSPNYPYGLGGGATPMSDSTSAAKDPATR